MRRMMLICGIYLVLATFLSAVTALVGWLTDSPKVGFCLHATIFTTGWIGGSAWRELNNHFRSTR